MENLRCPGCNSENISDEHQLRCRDCDYHFPKQEVDCTELVEKINRRQEGRAEEPTTPSVENERRRRSPELEEKVGNIFSTLGHAGCAFEDALTMLLEMKLADFQTDSEIAGEISMHFERAKDMAVDYTKIAQMFIPTIDWKVIRES